MITDSNWSFPPRDVSLSDGAVHVWTASFPQHESTVAELTQLLSNEEKERASRFHFERDRHHFIIARAFLRKILARYLNEDPRAITFAYGRNGKPELKNSSGLNFNLSHSGDLAVYAVARDRQIGIDAEQMQQLPDFDAIGGRFFLQEENDRLRLCSDTEKTHQFYRFWTCGEALLKWCGEGIVEPEQRRILTANFSGTVHEFSPAANYMGALVVSGKLSELRLWRWEEPVPLKILPKPDEAFSVQ